ncbi:hypothetical protein ABIE89_008929 [Bradyrhizobium niftali]
MIGGADCKFRAFDAANCGEVQIGAGFGRGCRNATAGWTGATKLHASRQTRPGHTPRRRGIQYAAAHQFITAVTESPAFAGDDGWRSGAGYFFAGACGWDGGTVSISLPVKTGAEVGWPLGEPPACSTVTA